MFSEALLRGLNYILFVMTGKSLAAFIPQNPSKPGDQFEICCDAEANLLKVVCSLHPNLC